MAGILSAMPKQPHLAICSARPGAVALAACAFALPPAGDGNTIEVQLTPAGDFTPSDGRALPVPAWRIDGAIADRVIAAFAARRNPAVLDYEHQSLFKEDNGQPAPAAGWIRHIAWRDGAGLFANVELTQRAKDYIAANEYRYISPVFSYDPVSGDVLAIQMAALTNTPAIDGMDEVQLRAAATFGLTPPAKEPKMDKLLKAMIAALALDAAATEDTAIAALTARIEEHKKLREAIGIPADADTTAAIAACSAIKAKAATSVDPAQYVPVGAVNELRAALAVLTAQNTAREVGDLIGPALEDGRLPVALEPWARDLGKNNLAALTAYLKEAKPIAALAGTQTGGKPPAGMDTAALNAAELAICTATGVTAEQFAKARPKA
jgi:phage I-like protein